MTGSARSVSRWLVLTVSVLALTWGPLSAAGQGAADVSGEITVWAFADDIIVNGIKAALPDFTTKYPNVQVDVVPISGAEVHTKLLAAIASGQGIPDVAHIGVWDPLTFVERDALTDITPNIEPYMGDILPYQIPPYQRDGKMYGVPWGGTAASMFYRRDVFEAAEINPDDIKTWDDFIAAGEKVASSTDGKVKMINLPIGTQGEKASLQHFQQLLAQQLHTGIYNEQGAVVVNDAGNLRTLDLIKRMIDAGIGADIEPWTPAEFASWKDGSVATIVNASWMKGIIEGQAPETAGKWGIMELPAFEAGGTRVSSAGGSGMVIPKASKNQAAAWAFVEFFLLNGQPQIAAYKAGAPIPSLMSTYADPVFAEPSEFWGGQKVGEFYAKLEPQVPTYYYSPNYREVMLSILPPEIWQAVTDEKEPQAALDEIKQTIESKFA